MTCCAQNSLKTIILCKGIKSRVANNFIIHPECKIIQEYRALYPTHIFNLMDKEEKFLLTMEFIHLRKAVVFLVLHMVFLSQTMTRVKAIEKVVVTKKYTCLVICEQLVAGRKFDIILKGHPSIMHLIKF